jgi:hypothetical protein
LALRSSVVVSTRNVFSEPRIAARFMRLRSRRSKLVFSRFLQLL